MSGPLYLAWRYLLHHRIKTALLVTSIALIVFLPAGLNVLVGEGAVELTARAERTPLLVGARGSPLELVLNSLYFESKTPELTSWAEVLRIEASDLADPIPLYVRFHVGEHPIVGTSLEYFTFRGLELESGRLMAVLGECVVGARAARRLDVDRGGAVISSPESVFDLAGSYPLRLRVSGILTPSHGPDDDAIFVDTRTAWIIQGLGHGHQDLTEPEAEAAVLAREAGRVTANASVVEYNEITSENADSFHFHGDPGRYPLTAVIGVPRDERSRVILLGRYQGEAEASQIVGPASVMEELLDTVLTIRSYVVAALATVGTATLATAALVFALSLRLRRREIETVVKIGASRGSVAWLLASEVVLVLLLALGIAGALTLLTSRYGAAAIRGFLLT